MFSTPICPNPSKSLLHSFMCFDLCWWSRNSSSLVKSGGWWNYAYAKRCSVVGLCWFYGNETCGFLWTKCVLNAVTVPNLPLFLKHKPCDTAAQQHQLWGSHCFTRNPSLMMSSLWMTISLVGRVTSPLLSQRTWAMLLYLNAFQQSTWNSTNTVDSAHWVHMKLYI